MKRVSFVILVTIALLASAAPAFADGPTSSPGFANASPSGERHGAFNFQNLVYGQPGTPGGSSASNSSYFGTSGGSGGGQTGINNSAGAPWGDTNKAANDPNP